MRSIAVVSVDPKSTLEPCIRFALEADGFTLVDAGQPTQSGAVLRDGVVDAVIMQSRQSDGLFATIRTVREQTSTPIMVLIEQGEMLDKVFALEFGADEFFVSPVNMLEFRARLHALIRRSGAGATRRDGSSRIGFGSWIMDPLRRELQRRDGGARRELTGAEFELLSIFVNAPNRVLSRDELMEKLRQRPWSPFDRGIDMLVRRLRLKIEEDPSRPRLIRTIRSLGYMFAESVRACD
jgi:two-component system OmpR family response regulator